MLRIWRCLFVAVASISVVASLVHAQETNSDPCAAKLIPYSQWSSVKTPSYSLETRGNKGRLYYVGAEHSSDPAHTQFAEIEKTWNEFKPTVAFYEGPNRPLASMRDETIRQTGESGFVRFLAARDGVPVVSLEPSPQDELKFLETRFSSEQIALFFLLRETARLRERRKMSETELAAAITQLLERVAKANLFENPIGNLEQLDAAYKRHWKNPPQWWQAPSDWFDPLKSSAETGGVFTNEVNQMSSGYRDLNMYRLLSSAALEGKRVFAVVGRNHVAMQAQALRCALK